jgi:hypothetical protein
MAPMNTVENIRYVFASTPPEIQVQMHSVFASAITVSKRAAMFTQVFSLDKIQEIMRIQKCQSPPSGD